MKNYFDVFYEIIHKNSVKRRRMVSLLLVLSVFVSSGVLWELRDTVVTLVNEPLCGIDEHEHTDECYEYRLVCGLEENEEHTHTEECWEKVLVCGHDEHMHTTLCYTDEDIPEADMAEADEFDDTVCAISNMLDVDDAELLAGDMPGVVLDNELRALDGESSLPPTVSTIDNIAEGIKFMLFDYGGDTLESQNNNYFYRWDNENNVWTHPNANTTDGINAGRNINDDILFLAYGTPVHKDCNDSNVYNHNTPVYEYDENNNIKLDEKGNPVVIGYRVTEYQPDKNSYSGDYNSTPVYSGNRPVSGIVESTLGIDGYPHIAGSGNSLYYLFAPTTKYTVNEQEIDQSAYKTVYTDVNHFLQKKNGHLVYNSNENYAYFDKDTNEFIVYGDDPDTPTVEKGTFEIINDNHHRINDVNNIKYDSNEQPLKYTDNKDPGFKIGFFPFDQYDETRKDPNYDGNGYNHHFGMTMEASFSNYVDTNDQSAEPIVFKYSGDDDMWVFVDDVLVLDIGGIHEPAAGMIDFTNGLVWTQDNALGDTAESAYNTLRNNNRDLPATVLLPDNGVNTDGESVSKWKVETIASKFADIADKNCGPNDGGAHTIKMFYLERGGCYSNLAMDMNLPTLKPLTVMKTVDYQQHLVKDPDIDNKSYEFQVYEWDNDNNVWAITQDSDPNGRFYLPDNNFSLKDGERKTFENLGQERKFKVVEVGVDPNIFEDVSVNGGASQQYDGSISWDVSSGETPQPLSAVNSYTFNNRVIEDDTTILKVVKDWETAGNKPADFTMKYRIMRTDSATGEVKQVALQYIDEEDGNKIKKRRVFALDAAHYESGNTHEGLLARYGNHIYSYRVEELNAPRGFKASYTEGTQTVEEDGVTKTYKLLTVTNTDVSKVDIYVKKQWVNVTDPKPEVKLVLKREKVGFSDSTPTSLTVNILDEGGNPIASKTIKSTDEHPVYANGSAEIYYQLPEGVVLYKGDTQYPQKQIGSNEVIYMPVNISCGHRNDGNHTHTESCYTDDNKPNGELYVKFEEDENILTVQNLSASSNTVTFKVTSDNAEDSLLLLHHSFTRGTNGWTVQNDMNKQTTPARIVSSTAVTPYAKGDAVVITDRSKSFNGAVLHLDPAKFKVNKTYTFSVYVYSPVADKFKMTFNNGLGQYRPIKEENGGYFDIPAEKWTQITGSLQLPEKIDPYNMFILIESEPCTKTIIVNGEEVQDTEACKSNSFRIDEFTAIEGTVPVSVDETTGIVRIGEAPSAGGRVYYHQFDGLGDGWTVRDYEGDNNSKTQTGSPENDPNGHYVRVWNRDRTSDGIQRQDVSFLVAGKTYKFKVGAQHAGNDPAGVDKVRLTLYLNGSTVPDGNGGNTEYPWVCTVDITPKPKQDNPSEMDYYIWGENEGDAITIPAGANVSGMHIYFETDSAYNNPTGPFRIRYVEVTEVVNSSQTSTLPDKPGYNESTGQYVSDYSNYGLTLDVNSVTNPLHLTGDYTIDNWSSEITLPYNGTLEYHWNKDALEEVHNVTEDYLYRYWIEEVKIGDGNVSNTIETVDGNKVVRSTCDNYIITYDRQFVSTNTSDTPILVTNKYIWYTLPATGGRGTTGIYILGSMLTAIGILSGSALYRRKRRRV